MKLTYRKTGINKELRRRLILLVAIFIVSLIGFTVLLNLQGDSFSPEQITEASLPTIKISSQGEEYGDFFGYKREIDPGRIRNGLIPLDSSRKIELSINTYDNDIKEATYQISSRNGEKRVAKEEIATKKSNKGVISNEISLSNLVDKGEEYLLSVDLNANGESLHYYMRIKYVEGGREKECLDFARYFTNTALSESYQELATYMEPREEERRGLSRVTINSSLNDVGWNGFGVVSHTEPSVVFSEIDESYTALSFDYFVEGGENNPGTYRVNEYYRMRCGEERIYLLDYERNITQLLNGDRLKLENGKLLIGQNGYDVNMVSNRTGNNIAFVWDGSLYEYNATSSNLTRVFHFGDLDLEDPRTTNNEHDINIINIDENGNINYAVYGYMNSGAHEGICGVGLYHYDSIEDHTNELVFLSTNHSYDTLVAGFDGDVFQSSTNKIYMCIEEEFICCDIETGSTQVVCDAREGSAFAVSEEGRYVALSDGEGRSINVRDLYSEEERQIMAPEGARVRVSTFMGEDLAYGIIPESEYTPENIENSLYPMSEIVIADVRNGQGEPLKTYNKDGRYVIRVTKENECNLSLRLANKIDRYYIEAENDSIQNTATLNEGMAEITPVSDGAKEIVAFSIPSEAEATAVQVTLRSFGDISISYMEGNVLEYTVDKDKSFYYAYRGERIVGSGPIARDAIYAGAKAEGYCVDNNGEYVWQYGRDNSKKSISDERISAIVDNPDKHRLNMVGCELEEVLPCVYRGMPVFLDEYGLKPVIITGYDNNSVTIKELNTLAEEKVLIQDTTQNLAFQSKTFSCYIIK